jgi:outer membrane lipoprotein-sorting protein
MSRKYRSRPLVLFAVVTLVALSGCAGVPLTEDDLSAQEIGEQVEQKYENVGTFTGTMTTETVFGNETRTSKANIWQNQSSSELRYEYLGPGAQNGTILVSNGSTMWRYNDTDNTAQKTNLSSIGTEGMSPDYQSVIENLLENYNVSYQGTYVLSLDPKNGSSISNITEELTFWVDQDNWFPVKRHSVSSFDNQTIESTTTYTNLTFDADVPADTFEFEPPENAEVTENEMPTSEDHDSVSEAAANVSFEVNEPEHLLDDYEFANATTTFANGNAIVSLVYENETSQLRVSQSNRTAMAGASDNSDSTMSINGHEATYNEYGSNGYLRWTCENYSYTVSGELPKSELTTVAESIDCE